MNLSGDNQGRTVSCADFALLRLLGEGSFGDVLLAEPAGGGAKRAIKVVFLSLSDYASLLLFIWRFVWGVV